MKISNKQELKMFSYSKEKWLDILCESSLNETIHFKLQTLFSEKKDCFDIFNGLAEFH